MHDNKLEKRNFAPKTNLFIVQSRKYDARDVPAHLELKTREKHQRDYDKLIPKNFAQTPNLNVPAKDIPSLKRDFKAPRNLKQKIDREQSILNPADEDDPELIFGTQKRNLTKKIKDDSKSDSESSNNSDDDDALMREFNRIKREREDEEKIKEDERFNNRLESASINDSIFTENTYSLRKRWFEDTLFKGRDKDRKEGTEQLKNNDVLRSGYHRKFLNKFIHT